MPTCTKAIIPVAGYGTRRLPITKSIEKCMLSLGNRPVIDYIVRDCAAAGITDIYFVVSGPAMQLRSYYERDMALEKILEQKGKTDLLADITPPESLTFHFVEQDLSDGRYGNTIPVWLCRDYIAEDELFMVIMGDGITYVKAGKSDIERLVELGAPAILGVPVHEGKDISRYGVIANDEHGIMTTIVEKPAPGTEPTRLINPSKYVFPGVFMRHANQSMQGEPGPLGEYLLTDPLNALIADGAKLQVVEAHGTYLDTGTVETWTWANAWLFNVHREQEKA